MHSDEALVVIIQTAVAVSPVTGRKHIVINLGVPCREESKGWRADTGSLGSSLAMTCFFIFIFGIIPNWVSVMTNKRALTNMANHILVPLNASALED